jgi:phosphoglycolate phosphatase
LSLQLLFDLDGTLTDPFPGISRCIAHALEQQGLVVPETENLRPWIGPPLLQSFADYFERLGAGDADLALFHYRQRFGETGLFENTVYEGVSGVLGLLADSGHRLYLATAKPAIYATKIVDHFSLGRFLVHSYGSELDGTRTDKVELLQYIIDREHLDPAECAMIGDRKHDMIAARYHGMRAIGVLWGYGSETELLEAGAEVLVNSPEELIEVMGRLAL